MFPQSTQRLHPNRRAVSSAWCKCAVRNSAWVCCCASWLQQRCL